MSISICLGTEMVFYQSEEIGKTKELTILPHKRVQQPSGLIRHVLDHGRGPGIKSW